MAELALMESTLLPANVHMDTLVEIVVQVCKSNFIQNVLNDFNSQNIPKTDFFNIFINFSDINDCEHNPCKNGGTCEDGIGAYTCTCPEGFMGVNCGISMYR